MVKPGNGNWRAAGLAGLAGMLALACGLFFPAKGEPFRPTLAPATPIATLSATAGLPATPSLAASLTALPGALAEDELAIYTRAGCFAGVHDTLTVKTDGKLQVVDRLGKQTQGSASAQDLQELTTLFGDPAFAKLAPSYEAMGADLCVYTVVARANGQARVVMTMDAAATPPILAKVIAKMNLLMRLAH
jgi:hypothetical protein